MGNESCCREERKVILMDPVLADIAITQQRKASPIRRKETMSRKERRNAIQALLGLVKKHGGEWTADKIISHFCFLYGYTRKTAEGYLGELVIAGLVEIREESLYAVEQKTPEKEAPEK